MAEIAYRNLGRGRVSDLDHEVFDHTDRLIDVHGGELQATLNRMSGGEKCRWRLNEWPANVNIRGPMTGA